jgi:hypothetical protein
MNTWQRVQVVVYRAGQAAPAVIGTDGQTWIDGRLSEWNARKALAAFAYAFAKSEGLEWRGEVYLLGGRHRTVTVTAPAGKIWVTA